MEMDIEEEIVWRGVEKPLSFLSVTLINPNLKYMLQLLGSKKLNRNDVNKNNNWSILYAERT